MPKVKSPKKKIAVKKTRVLVNCLQDRSGSMAGSWNETVNGLRVFLDELKAKEDIEYFFTLTLFDTRVESPVLISPLHKISSDILSNPAYGPRGGTSLYDALGSSIESVSMCESDFDKIVYIIITDGQENSSQKWTKDTLHTLIDAKLKGNKSTFQYLGAQPESWDDSSKIGLGAGQTLQYDQGMIGSTYHVMANGLNNFSSSKLSCTRSMTQTFADSGLIEKANLTVRTEDSEDSRDSADIK